jgi:hypothetical protein
MTDADHIPLDALRSSELVDADVLRHVEELCEESAPLHGDCLSCQRVRRALAELDADPRAAAD